MEFNFSSRPNRRFLFRLWGSIAVALLSAVAAEHVIEHEYVDGALIWMLALIPGIAAIGAFYAVSMLVIEQEDEFIRMLVLRQLIAGAGIAFSFAAIWGFLERFERLGPGFAQA